MEPGDPDPVASRSSVLVRPSEVGRLPPLAAVPALPVLVVFLGALLVMVLASLSVGTGRWGLRHYARFVSDPLYVGYLWRSLRVAAYCTVITLVAGYPMAWVMARASARIRLAISLLLVVQFFTSYIIRAYALILVLGNNGVVNRLLLGLGVIDHPLRLLYNELGVATSLVLIALPFMVFPIYSVLRNIEPNLESAATSLGANSLRVFWHVVLPLSLPGVQAGVVLVFLFDLTAFIMPGLLGGGYFDMAANLIYDQAMIVLDQPFAAALSTVLLVATVAALQLLNACGARLTERNRS